MLDIKYRFTSGDSDLGEIIKKCQNFMARIVEAFWRKAVSKSCRFLKKNFLWVVVLIKILNEDRPSSSVQLE